jgi:ketose-bisphosphate aldolase
MKELLRRAEKGKYAVGYFESFNMDCILAIVDAAEKAQSPVIIGFGGQFLSSPKRAYKENVYNYGAVAREIAKNASVPAAVLLNEADVEEMAYQGLGAGFNAVMYVKPGEQYPDTLRITKALCHAAHYMGIDVEGEFGELPCADIATGNNSAGAKTEVSQALEFVQETGIDSLSVSIGNVHLLESGHSVLDFELLEQLHKEVPTSLVLHGGTGVSDADMKKAISLGISKINVGTAIKRTYLNAVTKFIQEHDIPNTDAHAILGWGGDGDMLSVGREAITQLICEYFDLFGSAGKAKEF